MFKNLFKFGYQRTPVQAIGFFIFYLAVITLITFVIITIFKPYEMSDEELLAIMQEFTQTQVMAPELEKYFEFMKAFSAIVAVMTGGILGVLITWQKGIFRQHRMFAAVIITILLGYFSASPLVALIPLAWLTTRPDESTS